MPAQMRGEGRGEKFQKVPMETASWGVKTVAFAHSNPISNGHVRRKKNNLKQQSHK